MNIRILEIPRLKVAAPLLAAFVVSAISALGVNQAATISKPANGATLQENDVAFRWDAPAGATEYYLTLDTFQYGYRLFSRGTTGTSIMVPSLPSGATVHATLYTKSGGRWLPATLGGPYQVRNALANPCHLPITGRVDYTNEVFIDPAQPLFLQGSFQGTGNLSPIGAVTIPLTHTPVSLITGEQFGSSRYIDAAGDSLFFDLESFGIPDDPTNPMSPLTLFGRTVITGGTGKFNDARGVITFEGRSFARGFLPNGHIFGDAFTIFSGSIAVAAQSAAITSPANGSNIGSNNVTFSWNAPLGATEYYLTIDTFRQGYRLFSRGTTGTSIVVPNLPRGTRVYATLYTKCGGKWLERQATETQYQVQ